jgi:hypothetical protein
MSQTYASGAQDDTKAGRVILLISSSLAALLLLAALIYATGTGQRHEAALAAAGCEPSLSPSGLPCTTAQMLESQYMAVVTPASQQLNADVAAYTESETHNLAAAEAALTAKAATEHAFDAALAGITFPPAIAATAKALIRANQALAVLTAEQARSSTLTQLRSFNDRVQADSTAVQIKMTLILNALHSPPPQS